MKIKSFTARQILDSRGKPTVEVELNGFKASVASGASTGSFEAFELRDGAKAFLGDGVLKAVANTLFISRKLTNKNFSSQQEFDEALLSLDGTPNKNKLGANAILPISIAFSRALSAAEKKPLRVFLQKELSWKMKKRVKNTGREALPIPQFNLINGGRHAGIKNDVQEHLLIPARAKTFSQALQVGAEVYGVLKKILVKKFGVRAALVADEGGFAPPVSSVSERLELIDAAIEEAGWGGVAFLGLDCAASEFYEPRTKVYCVGGKKFSVGELIDFYESLLKSFKIISLEDGLAEDDWSSWRELMARFGGRIQIVGDDLLVTNVSRIKKAVELRAANALLLKPNQIGTVSETLAAAALAKDSGWQVIVSHRSGEVEDCFIADLAVGIGASQCKFGAPARGERVAKYNQLLRLEEEIGSKNFARFPFKTH